MHFDEKKYQLVKNMIPEETAKLLNWQFFDMIEKNLPQLEVEAPDSQVPGSFAIYGAYNFDTLLFMLKPKMEEVTGRSLIPTYTYARIYFNGQELINHKDRPSCEFSVTLNLGKTHDWPLYIENNVNAYSFTPYEFQRGDGMVYKGDLLHHYREPYTGEWYSQVFLHYIDANGPYRDEWAYDKRPIMEHPVNLTH